jgi:hypothetical protein
LKTKIKYDDWIETYSGIRFHPIRPSLNEFVIKDVAHALSMICRYTGHCSDFYSVAQHSVYVSMVCDEFRFEGLMHDAVEAYISDVNTTVKMHLDDYRELEYDIMEVMAKRFGFSPPPLPDEVKNADIMVLEWEHQNLFKSGIKWSTSHLEIDDRLKKIKFKALEPREACDLFMDTYTKIIGEKR